uniref:RBR-type E3 ubiquitin transferase n=1 Tax=Aegilops tauschii TaxID=37682 RepID=M8BEW3_AEGTA
MGGGERTGTGEEVVDCSDSASGSDPGQLWDRRSPARSRTPTPGGCESCRGIIPHDLLAMATMRPQTVLLPPRIDPMFIIDGNGGSLVNGNDIGDGCKGGVVELERCHDIIPPDLLDKWGFLLCESAFGTKRIYCPYRECSAPLLADSEAGVAAVTEAECPHCHRLFCVRCAVPWHGGITCNEFQKLGLDERSPEDILLRRLVGREGWQRCPKCQMWRDVEMPAFDNTDLKARCSLSSVDF